ncbi:two-component sensor histidine kinase, partial [Rheinheimera baltica]|nr:two-component sensor histidine kinase [Rheinheimera baltica]
MQRLFWHFYLFIFLVLLGSGWAVEQLWQHWNPPAQQPWLASYTALLQQQLQQPASTWPDTIPLTILAQPADSISWLADELAQLQQGNVISLFEAEKVYFYYLSNQQLLQLGPLTLVQNDGASWFTLLFFVLLAIAVAAWLWPVARDINSLQHSLTKFSVNIDTTLQ